MVANLERGKKAQMTHHLLRQILSCVGGAIIGFILGRFNSYFLRRWNKAEPVVIHLRKKTSIRIGYQAIDAAKRAHAGYLVVNPCLYLRRSQDTQAIEAPDMSTLHQQTTVVRTQAMSDLDWLWE